MSPFAPPTAGPLSLAGSFEPPSIFFAQILPPEAPEPSAGSGRSHVALDVRRGGFDERQAETKIVDSRQLFFEFQPNQQLESLRNLCILAPRVLRAWGRADAAHHA